MKKTKPDANIGNPSIAIRAAGVSVSRKNTTNIRGQQTNNPIAVIFTGIFMAMLDIVGLQLTNLTAYNEYITDVIISVIVYLSAFSLLIQMMLTGRKKKLVVEANKTTTADIPAEAETQPLDAPPEDIPDIPMEEAPQVPEQPEEGGEQA